MSHPENPFFDDEREQQGRDGDTPKKAEGKLTPTDRGMNLFFMYHYAQKKPDLDRVEQVEIAAARKPDSVMRILMIVGVFAGALAGATWQGSRINKKDETIKRLENQLDRQAISANRNSRLAYELETRLLKAELDLVDKTIDNEALRTLVEIQQKRAYGGDTTSGGSFPVLENK